MWAEAAPCSQLTGSVTLCGGPGKAASGALQPDPGPQSVSPSGPWDCAAHSREGLRLVARLLCAHFLKARHCSGQPPPRLWAPGKVPGGWSVFGGGGAPLQGLPSDAPLSLSPACASSSRPDASPSGREPCWGAPLPWHSPGSLAVRRLSVQEGQGRGRPRLLGETVNATRTGRPA